MPKNIVITGAMGSGKSTVLSLLQSQGLMVVEEPARQILAEQRSIGDEGVPDKNPKLFVQLMLSRTMYQYQQIQSMNGSVIYDRGIPDMIAYAHLFELDYKPAEQAAKNCRYDTRVFMFPAWEAIYTTDDERIMPFEAAKAFGCQVADIYQGLNYVLIEVPCVSPEKRAQFILDNIGYA